MINVTFRRTSSDGSEILTGFDADDFLKMLSDFSDMGSAMKKVLTDALISPEVRNGNIYCLNANARKPPFLARLSYWMIHVANGVTHIWKKSCELVVSTCLKMTVAQLLHEMLGKISKPTKWAEFRIILRVFGSEIWEESEYYKIFAKRWKSFWYVVKHFGRN